MPSDEPLPATGAARPRPARLFLVRHGESTWNRDHRIQGQLDPPLSELGLTQAQLVGTRLASRHPEAIYSSDLKRALETAAAIGAATGVRVQPLPALREIFLGEWEGLSTAEVADRFPDAWARWSVEPDWDLVPGGEPAAAFDDRVAHALDGTIEHHPHGDVIVVTHGGVIQTALHRIFGKPSRGLFPFRISNASITLIEKRDGRVIIAAVNDTAHLEDGADRPVGPG